MSKVMDLGRTADDPTSSRRGLRYARAAALVGLLYTSVSVYWGLGGTALLDTLGGSLAREGRRGDTAVLLALWTAVGLKLIASGLPLLLALGRPTGSRWHRIARALSAVEATILTAYGLVLTTAGLMVQAAVIHAAPTADHRALAWHAYLWDPWFLIWGLLVAAALQSGVMP